MTFQDLMTEVSEAMANRTILHPTERKMKEYNNGQYHPPFSLLKRGGKLVCIWQGNRKKRKFWREPEIARLSVGMCKKGLTSDEWDELTLEVMHSLGLVLGKGVGELVEK